MLRAPLASPLHIWKLNTLFDDFQGRLDMGDPVGVSKDYKTNWSNPKNFLQVSKWTTKENQISWKGCPSCSRRIGSNHQMEISGKLFFKKKISLFFKRFFFRVVDKSITFFKCSFKRSGKLKTFKISNTISSRLKSNFEKHVNVTTL